MEWLGAARSLASTSAPLEIAQWAAASASTISSSMGRREHASIGAGNIVIDDVVAQNNTSGAAGCCGWYAYDHERFSNNNGPGLLAGAEGAVTLEDVIASGNYDAGCRGSIYEGVSPLNVTANATGMWASRGIVYGPGDHFKEASGVAGGSVFRDADSNVETYDHLGTLGVSFLEIRRFQT
jgi:hypothetical protein